MEDEIKLKLEQAKQAEAELNKIESSEKLGIKTVISSLSIDREGEVVDISTAEFRRTKTGELDVPVLLDHNYGTREIIGKVTGYDYSLDGDRGTGANPEYANDILVNPDVNTVAVNYADIATGVFDNDILVNPDVNTVAVNYADIATGVFDAECGTDCPLDKASLVMNKCTYSELLKIWNTSCNISCASTANQTDFGGVEFREIFGYPIVIVNSKDRNGDYFVPTGTVIMGDFSQYV